MVRTALQTRGLLACGMLHPGPMALPPQIGREPQAVALVCPECGGSVAVHAEGDAGRYLVFNCRVGHAFSARTLVAGKEDRVEHALWSAVYLLEELAGLLADLIERDARDGRAPDWPGVSERIRRLHGHAKDIRAVLERNEPIDLGAPAAGRKA